MSGLDLVAIIAYFNLMVAVVGAGYLLGFKRGREWVWRRERDYWKENQ